ncbi:hypothetical protein SDC9_46357 [bioreactor metagenome]|uniref:Uncharacterized protein n=1 Tax=bioreactor metagenome TaxID=1076179 RepID=A0A644WCS5_9ZZZZ
MKNPVNRPTLFLTELILDLFIFAVCTVVCASLLVKATGMSRESAELTRAVYLAQSAAEAFQAEEPLPVGEQDGLFLSAALSEDSGLRTAEITIFSADGRLIYALTTSCLGKGDVS